MRFTSKCFLSSIRRIFPVVCERKTNVNNNLNVHRRRQIKYDMINRCCGLAYAVLKTKSASKKYARQVVTS